jgi:predicted phosphoribosyltransferase
VIYARDIHISNCWQGHGKQRGRGTHRYHDPKVEENTLTCIIVVEKGVEAGAVHVEVVRIYHTEAPADLAVSVAGALAAGGKVWIMDCGFRREGDESVGVALVVPVCETRISI